VLPPFTRCAKRVYQRGRHRRAACDRRPREIRRGSEPRPAVKPCDGFDPSVGGDRLGYAAEWVPTESRAAELHYACLSSGGRGEIG